MSHHLDTPLAAQTGQLFLDDLYVFDGDLSTVLIMTVNSTITGAYAKPDFHPEARYEFRVHLDGADFEDLTYRVAFGAADSDGRQALRLNGLWGPAARGDDAVGETVIEGHTGETATGPNVRLWAGRVWDSFYIDLSLLGLVNAAVDGGGALDLAHWNPDKAQNSFANSTVAAIVLEISHDHAQLSPGARIGVWAATKLATDSGGWRQINRAGHPMMWPIFWPDDTHFTGKANTRHPSDDVAEAGKAIADAIAATVAATGTSADPRGYGETVARELFPDVLSYVVGTPTTYGFAARNGRTLADNAPEVMLSLVVDTAVPSGLRPDVAAHLRGDRFPYVMPA
ncbi:DUF4331 family protein [Streptosporangiaceae bacterium NEAU-GS5]|nr:DUF4331 family protein [Streptosporangiaceae bacterium NEAU-GS5]